MQVSERSGARPPLDMPPSGRSRQELSLATSALWLIAAKTAAFALSFAVPVFLVRHLAVREFGVYRQVFLVLDTAIMILPLGFAMSAFYFFPRQPAKKAQVIAHILLVHAVMGGLGGVLVVIFPTLLATVLNSPELAAYAPAIGIAILFAVVASLVESVAIANGEARFAAFIITVMQVLRSALLVLAGTLLGSVRALVYAGVVYGIVQSGVMFWYVRSRFLKGRWAVDWGLLQTQIAYALPLAYSGFLWWLQTSVHYYFVSNRFGAAAYAIYAVGCFQLPIMGIVQGSVGSVVIPRVSDLSRRNETREIVRLVAAIVRALAVLALPLYVLLLVTRREFITVLFTAKYAASWPIFAINLTLIPLSIIGPAEDAVFRASPKHLPFLVTVRTVLQALLLAGLWIATHRSGLVAAIEVVIAVTLVERGVIAAKVARILGMAWSDLGLFRDVAKVGGAAGVAGVATDVARRILLGHAVAPLAVLGVSVGVFAAVLLAAGLLFRIPTPGEWETIRQWLAPARRAVQWRSAAKAVERERRERAV